MIESIVVSVVAIVAVFFLWAVLALQLSREMGRKVDRFINEAYDSLPREIPWTEIEALSERIREQIIKSYPWKPTRLAFWTLRVERKVIACETWQEWLELEL